MRKYAQVVLTGFYGNSPILIIYKNKLRKVELYKSNFVKKITKSNPKFRTFLFQWSFVSKVPIWTYPALYLSQVRWPWTYLTILIAQYDAQPRHIKRSIVLLFLKAPCIDYIYKKNSQNVSTIRNAHPFLNARPTAGWTLSVYYNRWEYVHPRVAFLQI